MENKVFRIDVSWTEDNFCCGWSDENAGTVLVTAKTLEKLKEDFRESLNLHIQLCLAEGDNLPEYLAKGDYKLEYILDAAALLRDAETYTTMAAISRASGINPKQLSHYASGLKHPRPMQVERIKAGIHRIGSQLLSLG